MHVFGAWVQLEVSYLYDRICFCMDPQVCNMFASAIGICRVRPPGTLEPPRRLRTLRRMKLGRAPRSSKVLPNEWNLWKQHDIFSILQPSSIFTEFKTTHPNSHTFEYYTFMIKYFRTFLFVFDSSTWAQRPSDRPSSAPAIAALKFGVRFCFVKVENLTELTLLGIAWHCLTWPDISWILHGCITMWTALLVLLLLVSAADPDDSSENFGWKDGGSVERLRFFKERLGFEARHVLDIGAHVGEWTVEAQKVFPSAEFLMVEANPQHRADLEAVGQPFVIALLAARDNESMLFHSTRYPITTGASLFRERSDLFLDPKFSETLLLRSRTLDDLVASHFSGECCDLLKADVQGAELAVLLGGLKTLSQAELVLLEAPVLPYNEGAPRFSELIEFMASQGFEVVDVADVTYSEGVSRVLHLDLLFAQRFSRLLRIPLPGGIRPAKTMKRERSFSIWNVSL